ncbi:MAG: molybdopterin synthase catalytic subunit [Acidimicrobiales bacterium]
MTTTPASDWVAVSADALCPEDLRAWTLRPECGAVVMFCGTARSTSTSGHEVTILEYETEPALAEARLVGVVNEARRRWPEIGAVALHHRVGQVALTEPAVVVVVSAAHRGEAFDAARFCIDALKRCVPMWKREVWEGGSAWSEESEGLVRVEDL